MIENRRDFIKLIVLASLAPYIASAATKKMEELVIIPNGSGGKVWVWNWSQNKLSEIDVPLGPIHSAMQMGPQQILLFEYFGRSILRYNLETHEQQKIELGENEFFIGHGALSPDGRFLLTVELTTIPHSIQTTSRIVVRDAKTLQKLHILYSSKDTLMHDLFFLQDNRLIFSRGNYVEPSVETKISFFNWNTATALGEISQEVILAGIYGNNVHFLALPNNRFLVLPIDQELIEKVALEKIVKTEKSFHERIAKIGNLLRYKPTPLFIFESDGAMTKLWSEKDQQMFLRNLSSCRLQTPGGDFTGVTHPAAHNFTIWKGEGFFKRINLGNGNSPGGIAYSQQKNELLVADLTNGLLHFFSVPEFEEKKSREIQLGNGSGAVHLLHLS
jgi:hypothetical protein